MRCVETGKYYTGSRITRVFYVCEKHGKTYHVIAEFMGRTVGGDQIWSIKVDGVERTKLYFPSRSRAYRILPERIYEML